VTWEQAGAVFSGHPEQKTGAANFFEVFLKSKKGEPHNHACLQEKFDSSITKK
jgi:hypothetical protein